VVICDYERRLLVNKEIVKFCTCHSQAEQSEGKRDAQRNFTQSSLVAAYHLFSTNPVVSARCSGAIQAGSEIRMVHTIHTIDSNAGGESDVALSSCELRRFPVSTISAVAVLLVIGANHQGAYDRIKSVREFSGG
jgi:hypothetical protein